MNKYTIITTALVAVGVLSGLPHTVEAQAKKLPECVFLKDLEMGAVSEEVRCLQKYLNTTEFKVSESGVGSAGNETNLFREGTEAAVKKWQKANGLPDSGFFGPMSRIKYYELLSPLSPSTPEPQKTTVITPAPVTLPVVQPVVKIDRNQENARNKIKEARDLIRKVTGTFEDAEEDDDEVGNAEEMLEEAEDVLIQALYSYVDGGMGDAFDLATEAIDQANEARKEINDIDGEGLTKAEAIIFNNETIIKVRFDGEEYVFTTDETSERDIVDEIVDEIDDNDLTEDDVEDMLDIETEDRDSEKNDKQFVDEDDAQDALEDAQDAIDDAQEEIEDADDDGKDTEEAEELLEEAEELYEEAEEELDNGDYEDAIELAVEAMELAEEAEDAL